MIRSQRIEVNELVGANQEWINYLSELYKEEVLNTPEIITNENIEIEQ